MSAVKSWGSAAAKSLQSCLTLCDPIDGSPPGSRVPCVLQARTLEWAAISFSNAWKWKVKVKLLSRVQLLVTPWTVAHQAPPSMGFSRQEYWSGVPLPSPHDALHLNNTVLYVNYISVKLVEEMNERMCWGFVRYSMKGLLPRTSLTVQCLKLCAPSAENPGSIPGQGTRSCLA